MVKLGDVVHAIAQPIAVAIDTVAGTDLQNCSGCVRRQQWLNNLSDSIYDYLWKGTDDMADEEKGEYIIQLVITASDVREAIANMEKAKVVSITPRAIPSKPSTTTVPLAQSTKVLK